MVSDLDDLDGIRECSEQQELSGNGVVSPDTYKQLLAIYLIDNDVVNAKFLWKRIPPAIKAENSELQAIWKIGQYLWKREFASVYPCAKNEEWSSVVQPLIEKLVVTLRRRMVRLVVQAYSVIRVGDLGNLLGLTEAEAIELATTESWDINSEERLIRPRRVLKESYNIDQLETFDQLMNSLTDYVTFLEN